MDISKTNSNIYRRILVSRLDRIGDVLLSTPVFKAIKEAYPGSYVACMVRPYANDIVNGNPYIDKVILYDKDGAHKSFFPTLKFALNLKNEKFDLSINLHPTNRSNLIPFLAGVPKRVGWDKKLGFLLTCKLKHDKQMGTKHELEYTLDVIRSLGIEPKDKRTFIPGRKENYEKVKDVLRAAGLSENDLIIAIHPGASCPSKRWSADRFAELADQLATSLRAKVVIIAGPVDVEIGNKVANLMKSKSLNLSGKTSIADLAALFKMCRLFVSNDSGPVHIASAVGTPVISIFGRNEPGLGPKRWGPVGRGDVFLQKDVGCAICFAHNCKLDFRCLKDLQVQEVFDAAKEMLVAENAINRRLP